MDSLAGRNGDKSVKMRESEAVLWCVCEGYNSKSGEGSDLRGAAYTRAASSLPST